MTETLDSKNHIAETLNRFTAVVDRGTLDA